MIDFASGMYIIEIGVCFCIFVMFGWWSWYKWKHCHKITSPMYNAVMLLFFFQAYAMCFGLSTRINRVEEAVVLTPCLDSFWWHSRVIGRMVMEIVIGYIQGKIIYIEFFKDKNKPNRRRGDRLRDDI